MNIKTTIHLLLQKLSLSHNIYYMEKRYYKLGKASKSFFLKIDDELLDFKSQLDLLAYLSKRK